MSETKLLYRWNYAAMRLNDATLSFWLQVGWRRAHRRYCAAYRRRILSN